MDILESILSFFLSFFFLSVSINAFVCRSLCIFKNERRHKSLNDDALTALDHVLY